MVLSLSYSRLTAFRKALSKISFMFQPVLAEQGKYQQPRFLAYAITSVWSTSFARPSHLFPTKITTASLLFTPQFFITVSHFPRLLKLSLHYRSKTSRMTCAPSQKGFLISSQSGDPLRSKKLTATFLPEMLTFFTPQSTPMVVMYFWTNRPQQQRFMIQDLPTLTSPTDMSYVRWKLLLEVLGCPPQCVRLKYEIISGLQVYLKINVAKNGEDWRWTEKAVC